MTKAEQTKDTILNAAQKLFTTKGYEATSVSDILNETGLSKGGLYHHFKSKEEIMDSVIMRIMQRGLDTSKQMISNKEIPVMQRIFMMFMANQSPDPDSLAILEQIHHPQNALMHQKSLVTGVHMMVPLLADLIEEGVASGIFNTQYPRESAEALYICGQFMFDEGLFQMTEVQKQQKLLSFICMIERTVGAEPGSAMMLLPIFQS